MDKLFIKWKKIKYVKVNFFKKKWLIFLIDSLHFNNGIVSKLLILSTRDIFEKLKKSKIEANKISISFETYIKNGYLILLSLQINLAKSTMERGLGQPRL